MNRGDGNRILHLIDAPHAAPVLVRWFIEEWAPWYGPDGDGDAAADLAACQGRDGLPICLVALGQDDVVLGTVSLRSESVGSEFGVGPWLAALLVGVLHRGRGVATALVAALEDEARRLGFTAIYTSAGDNAPQFTGRGWRPVGEAPSLRGAVSVLRLDLAPPITGRSE